MVILSLYASLSYFLTYNRVQLLEQDNKRLLAVQSSSSDAGVVTETQSLLENLTQDIAHLQGQLSTTEQLLKQTEVFAWH